jgi:hypothetical protein
MSCRADKMGATPPVSAAVMAMVPPGPITTTCGASGVPFPAATVRPPSIHLCRSVASLAIATPALGEETAGPVQAVE